MAEQSTAVLTFHKVREQCEQGSFDAWRAFLEFYSPLAFHLLKMYLPAGDPEPDEVWQQTLSALGENDFTRFRSTDRQSEREFLADIRALLLDKASQASGQGSQLISGEPSVSLDSLKKLVEGLPLLHQEMLFMKLAGYTDISIERMLRMAPRVAQAAFARLDPEFQNALKIESDRCPWPHQWLTLMQQARAAKQESCPIVHQFLRIHDGQVSWYDKEPVEKHVSGCLHCLDAWTALREVAYWRQAATGVSVGQIDKYLGVLPLKAPQQKSLFKKLFG